MTIVIISFNEKNVKSKYHPHSSAIRDCMVFIFISEIEINKQTLTDGVLKFAPC